MDRRCTRRQSSTRRTVSFVDLPTNAFEIYSAMRRLPSLGLRRVISRMAATCSVGLFGPDLREFPTEKNRPRYRRSTSALWNRSSVAARASQRTSCLVSDVRTGLSNRTQIDRPWSGATESTRLYVCDRSHYYSGIRSPRGRCVEVGIRGRCTARDEDLAKDSRPRPTALSESTAQPAK